MDSEDDINLDADEGEEMIGVGYFDDASEGDASNDVEQAFDITLTASHSYMGGSLSDVSGRAVLEAGWAGRVPVRAHHGVVFPGETVPMLLHHARDAAALAAAIRSDRLFGLLCPADSTARTLARYGVLCEVFEAALGGGGGGGGGGSVSFKARALHRFHAPALRAPVYYADYLRVQPVDVVVLPDVPPAPPLRLRPTRRARVAAAALTPWPLFVFELGDYERLRGIIWDYFRGLGLEKMLPDEPISLSFWVASNLTVTDRARLQLFTVDDALLRLYMECGHIARAGGAGGRCRAGPRGALCCAMCGAELARRADVFAMSSAGVRSNYTNPGGHVHDVLTVAAAQAQPSGERSREYSWFPGYAWTVALCPGCTAHVGWRFDALSRRLRPQQFYGLCRNHVRLRDERASPPLDADLSPPSPPPALL